MEIKYFCDPPSIDQFIYYIHKCRFQSPPTFLEVIKIGSQDHYFLGNVLSNTQLFLDQWKIILKRGLIVSEQLNTFDGRKLSRELQELSHLRNQASLHFDFFLTHFGEDLEIDGEVLLSRSELAAVRQSERELLYQMRPFQKAEAYFSRKALLAWRIPKENIKERVRILSGRGTLGKRSPHFSLPYSIAFTGLFILIPTLAALACHKEPMEVAKNAFYSAIDFFIPWPTSPFIEKMKSDSMLA